MKEVTEKEFKKFRLSYPNETEIDICGIFDPPLVTLNDKSLRWPESVIGKIEIGKDRTKDKYFIKVWTYTPLQP